MPCRLCPIAVLLCTVAFAGPGPAATFDPGPLPSYATAVLVEASTGTVLFDHHAQTPRSPASTIKLLLELVVMDQIEAGRCSLHDTVMVSARSSRTGGSQVYLREGEAFPLGELMEAIVLPSANDACVAVAEHIGGSAEAFVDMMNQRARTMGLQQTHCVNVHGLDDTPPDAGNVTTAYELAQIGRELVRHPQILAWSSVQEKPFRGGQFTLRNTNKLLGQFSGLDGLKTGYTSRAGFCLVATAQRDSLRLIAVAMGAPTERDRRREVSRLLTWGFNNYTRVPLTSAGQLVGKVPVDWGHVPEVRAVTREAAAALLARDQEKGIQRHLTLAARVDAPVAAGDSLGRLEVVLGDSLLAVVAVVADSPVPRMTVWEKLVSWFE